MLHNFEPAQSAPVHYATVLTPPMSTSGSPQPTIAVSSVLDMAPPKHHHIFIVTGPAGCGKSTVAKFLADRYGFEYVEGDDVSGTHKIAS